MRSLANGIGILCLIGVLLACAAERQNMSLPAADSEVEGLIARLQSTDIKTSVSAHLRLVKLGETLLPRLLEEMNKNQYLSKETNNIAKLGDPKWQKRIRLAGVIQDITKKEFHVNTTAHGWNPDGSFDQINEWWRNHQQDP